MLGPMQPKSAPVILDLIAFLQLIHETIGIDGISAQAVSDNPLNLIASFGMVRVNKGDSVSTWAFESREQINWAMQLGRRHLIRLKGLVPEALRDEQRSFVQLMRR